MSWGLYTVLVMEGAFLVSFIALKCCSIYLGLIVTLTTFAVSVLMISFCLACIGAMLYYHDQIADYRDKIL